MYMYVSALYHLVAVGAIAGRGTSCSSYSEGYDLFSRSGIVHDRCSELWRRSHVIKDSYYYPWTVSGALKVHYFSLRPIDLHVASLALLLGTVHYSFRYKHIRCNAYHSQLFYVIYYVHYITQCDCASFLIFIASRLVQNWSKFKLLLVWAL